MGDIGRQEIDLFKKRLPAVHEFTDRLSETLGEVLSEVRHGAQKIVPKAGYRPGEVEIPAVVRDFKDQGKRAIGDYVYAYEGDRNLENCWYVGWGFQVITGGSLQAFVCVESEYDGPALPQPAGPLLKELRKSGWRFPFITNDDRGERAALFEKTVDPATFLRKGFSTASSQWFLAGIREAAQILKAGRAQIRLET